MDRYMTHAVYGDRDNFDQYRGDWCTDADHPGVEHVVAEDEVDGNNKDNYNWCDGTYAVITGGQRTLLCENRYRASIVGTPVTAGKFY
jgi:hypothetical protein